MASPSQAAPNCRPYAGTPILEKPCISSLSPSHGFREIDRHAPEDVGHQQGSVGGDQPSPAEASSSPATTAPASPCLEFPASPGVSSRLEPTLCPARNGGTVLAETPTRRSLTSRPTASRPGPSSCWARLPTRPLPTTPTRPASTPLSASSPPGTYIRTSENTANELIATDPSMARYSFCAGVSKARNAAA